MTGKTLKELNVQVGDVVRCDGKLYFVVIGNHPYRYNSPWLCGSHDGDIYKKGWSSGTDNCTLISRAKKYTTWQFTPAPENAETHTMPDGSIAWRVVVEPVVTEVVMYVKANSGGSWIGTQSSHSSYRHKIKFNTIDGVPDCASVKMELLS